LSYIKIAILVITHTIAPNNLHRPPKFTSLQCSQQKCNEITHLVITHRTAPINLYSFRRLANTTRPIVNIAIALT